MLTPPQNVRSRPNSRFKAKTSIASGWMGCRMSRPSSMRSGMIADTLPQEWSIDTSPWLLAASVSRPRRGLTNSRQLAGDIISASWKP